MAASYQLPKLKAERLSVLVDLAQGVCGGIPSSLEQDDESSDGPEFIVLFYHPWIFFLNKGGSEVALYWPSFLHCRVILRCNC